MSKRHIDKPRVLYCGRGKSRTGWMSSDLLDHFDVGASLTDALRYFGRRKSILNWNRKVPGLVAFVAFRNVACEADSLQHRAPGRHMAFVLRELKFFISVEVVFLDHTPEQSCRCRASCSWVLKSAGSG